MADITEYLEQIENAVYGKDVRQAIHDGIEQCYEDGKAGAIDMTARNQIASVNSDLQTSKTSLQNQIDEIVAPEGDPSLTEVANARIDAEGTTHTTLKERCDADAEKVDELKSALISNDHNDGDVSSIVGGVYSRYTANRVSSMKNGSGEDKTETSNLHFHKLYVKGATSVTLTLETVTVGNSAHWVNELSEDGTVLSYASVTYETGSNKSYIKALNSSCAYIVISVWVSNGNLSATADYGTKITQTIFAINGRVISLENTQEYHGDNIDVNIKNIEILEDKVGGAYALNGFSRVGTMIGTDGTTKYESSALHFYECSDLKSLTSLDFVFSNTTSGTATHWFNQYDNEDNLLSYVSFNATVGENKHNVVNLESGCVKVVISIWINTNLEWFCMYYVNTVSKFTKISGLGDSITAGYSQYETVINTYQKLIADRLGATYQNLGISSTPVCPNSDYTEGQNDNAFVYRYGNIATDADLIIIAGGTNDFRHNVPIGTSSDDDTQYEQTFYGACDYLLKNIFTNYISAKIVWVSPFHQMWDNTTNSIGNTLEQYMEAIKYKCRKYGVTYIDAYACSGMNRSTACINTYMPDSIHPNTAGHALIYKNLMPYFLI